MSEFALRLMALFGAGVVSFAAPCVLPLLPAYIGVLGLDAADARHGPDGPGRRWAGSLGFVIGLATTFALFGAATARGLRTIGSQRAIEIGGGLLMIICGLAAIGLLHVLGAQLAVRRPTRRRRLAALVRGGQPLLDAARAVPTPLRALAVGAAFGAGWSPCVGPLLGGALGTAALDGSTWHGAALLGSFALGLGVPFVTAGLLLSQLDALGGRWRSWLHRWSKVGERVAGAVLIVVGVAVLGGDVAVLINPVATVAGGVF